MADSIFGATFAKLGQQSSRIEFEIQFRQMQNTLIRRFNERVDEVNARVSSKTHQIKTLQKQSVKLADSLPIIEAYRVGNLSNGGALDALLVEIKALQATINTDNNVTAEEITAFNAQRDIVATKLNNLYILVHPNVVDGNVILNLKNEIDDLNALAPVVGTLADNVAVTDYLSQFKTQTETALSTTENTIAVALDLEQKIQSDFVFRQTKILELTNVEQAKRDEELESVKVDLANFLRAISISFEVNKDFVDLVSSRLSKQPPPPGSILNLFS